MLPSSQPDRFAFSLPSQRVRGGPLCFYHVGLTVSPCLYTLSGYVGFSMLPSNRPDLFALSLPSQLVRGGNSLCVRQVDLTVSPCHYLLSWYVGVLYASVKST
jgi:hypothetical protein